ncbi:MAG: DUF1552 domain-containing protein [Myxococcota bacterium]
MSIIHRNRRSFLRGLGGSVLSLPFLQSLAPSHLQAQADAVPLRLVVFVSKFGVYARHWHETSVDPSERLEDNAHAMPLADFGDRSINRVLGNRFRRFYPKMNLIRGLDSPSREQNHNTSIPLSASCSGRKSTTGTGERINAFPVSSHSIDALLDERIYGAEPHLRAIRIAPFMNLSGGAMRWISISHRDGMSIPSETSMRATYNRLFGDLADVESAGPTAQERQISALDAALPEVRRTLEARRLSGADRRTLEQYLDRVNELRSDIAGRRSAVCSVPGVQALEVDGYDHAREIYDSLNEMIVSSFTCDLTRIAIINGTHATANPRHVIFHGNSHHEVREPGQDHDDTDRDYYQTQAGYFFDLAERMDSVVEANGRTMLDNSILLWTNTQGAGDGHRCNNIPIVTLGSGGGQIRTGQFLDYQQRPIQYEQDRYQWRPVGRFYSYLLQDIMRCFGLGPSDWEMLGEGNGFGDHERAERANYWNDYLNRKNARLPGFLV